MSSGGGGQYRRGVGIMLLNADNQVFVGERLDNPGAWQMPQGGIDDGETVEQAFFRELQEEVGTGKAEILRVYDTPMRYDLPPRLRGKLWGGKYVGQEQIWIAARFTGQDSDIDIAAHDPAEFKRWQWVTIDRITDLIVPFKRETYRQVIKAFEKVIGG